MYQRYQDHELSPHNITYENMEWIFENEHLYKVLYEDRLIGAIYVSKNPDKFHMKLHGIYVIPEFQNKGIGQKTIEFVESQYPDTLTWVLETPHDLHRNHHVYEKIGYIKTGQVDFVNDRLSIIHYKKEI